MILSFYVIVISYFFQHADEGIYKDLWGKMMSMPLPKLINHSVDVWNLVASSDIKYAGLADETFVQVVSGY